jgi:hypothetical protein
MAWADEVYTGVSVGCLLCDHSNNWCGGTAGPEERGMYVFKGGMGQGSDGGGSCSDKLVPPPIVWQKWDGHRIWVTGCWS